MDINGKVYARSNLGKSSKFEFELKLEELNSGEYLLLFQIDKEKRARKSIKN
jgi:hypothetical protein